MNKKTTLLLGALLLVVGISAAAVFFGVSGGTTAVISKDGRILHEIRLDTLKGTSTFHIVGENGEENVVRAEHGRVCMESASCPDQVCVDQGYIDNGALPIVCLPNKVIITIEGGEDSIDAAAK